MPLVGPSRVCQSMPEYARVCQSMPEYARVCQSMPEYARVCQSMPEYARVCQSMQEYARVCHSMPEYAIICQSMPGYARVCQGMSVCARVCQCALTICATFHNPISLLPLASMQSIALHSIHCNVLQFYPRWKALFRPHTLQCTECMFEIKHSAAHNGIWRDGS